MLSVMSSLHIGNTYKSLIMEKFVIVRNFFIEEDEIEKVDIFNHYNFLL